MCPQLHCSSTIHTTFSQWIGALLTVLPVYQSILTYQVGPLSSFIPIAPEHLGKIILSTELCGLLLSYLAQIEATQVHRPQSKYTCQISVPYLLLVDISITQVMCHEPWQWDPGGSSESDHKGLVHKYHQWVSHRVRKCFWGVGLPSDRQFHSVIRFASHWGSSRGVVDMLVWDSVGVRVMLKYFALLGCEGSTLRYFTFIHSSNSPSLLSLFLSIVGSYL